MPDLDRLKAIVQAFIENSIFYLDTDNSHGLGWYCDCCGSYFEPVYPEISPRDHDPHCLVLQAQAVLNDTP